MRKESFTPEKFHAGGWEHITHKGSRLHDKFIRNNQLIYNYGGDYFNMDLMRAALEVTLEYPSADNVRKVICRTFLETSGKLRFWTSDWQITQDMLAAAPYFHSWVGTDFNVYCNAVKDYAK